MSSVLVLSVKFKKKKTLSNNLDLTCKDYFEERTNLVKHTFEMTTFSTTKLLMSLPVELKPIPSTKT